MNPSFSVYLELARIVATLMVFLSHGLVFYLPEALYDSYTLALGRNGVIVFFLLSGFVITWCAHEREPTAREFFINRASRIYSVAIPGVLLSFACAYYIAIQADVGLSYQFEKLYVYFPIYLSFSGDFWLIREVPPSNTPYWSLNFEVWYYVLFAVFFYVKNRLRWVILFALMLLIGPRVLSLFPLWLAGSFLYAKQHLFKLPVGLARGLFGATLVLFVLIKMAGIDYQINLHGPQWRELLHLPSVVPHQIFSDYFMAVIVFINFVAAMNANFSFSDKAVRVITLLASFSFSFYLFHAPLFAVFEAHFEARQSLLDYVLVLSSTAVIIVLLARFTEHKKRAYRQFFKRWL